MTLGEKIKLARKQAGLSQEQLAEKIGVSRSAVAKWEVNNGMPDIDNLKALSQLLGVTIDSLVNSRECFADEGAYLEQATIAEEPATPNRTTSKKWRKAIAVILLIIFICAAGNIGGYMFSTVTTLEMKSYTVTSDIKSLYVNINAADITVKQGEAFSVESNLKYLTVSYKNGLLSIKDTKKAFGNYNHAKLMITIPAGIVFENTELKTGAGRLVVETLAAQVLDCDFGAGEIRIDSLSAFSSADIDGGAGEITISAGRMNDLEFDMGVGRLNFTSMLTGKCDFDFGIGESNITLIGSEEDYTLDIERGIGNIQVNGITVADFGCSGNGQNKIKISGGIGAIHLEFCELDT